MATTRTQEREALDRIRKIVAELGEFSYIGTAFEGCFEIAEDNIENDFGCSMKQRAESAERKAQSAEQSFGFAKDELEKATRKVELCKETIERLQRK